MQMPRHGELICRSRGWIARPASTDELAQNCSMHCRSAIGMTFLLTTGMVEAACRSKAQSIPKRTRIRPKAD